MIPSEAISVPSLTLRLLNIGSNYITRPDNNHNTTWTYFHTEKSASGEQSDIPQHLCYQNGNATNC